MVRTLDENLQPVDGLEAYRAMVRQQLRLKRGEWFLNKTAGRSDLAALPENLWSVEIADAIRRVDGVTGVQNLTVDKNAATGLLRCTGVVETPEGTFELDEEIEP